MRSSNLAIVPDGRGGVRHLVLPDLPGLAGQEVLVRMVRAPVNPADLLAIDGRYAIELDSDAPLGAEGVGMVEAVGPDVAGLRHGDAVLPLTRGNWRRHRLVNQRDLVVLPAGIDIDQAAMLRINPLTAWLLLDAAGVQPGEAVLQNAAGSALARWVRFLAAQRGIFVVDVVRRADPELARALVDGSDLAARAKAAAGGRPLRAALDCVAGKATGRAAECLAPGGRLMLFGHLSGAPIEVRSQVLTGGGLSVIGFSLRPTEAALGPERVQRLFAELFSMLGDSAPVVPVQTIIPLSNAEAAVAAARAGAKGRVLLDLTA